MCSTKWSVSAFANVMETNQRLGNKNSSVIISRSGLMTADRRIDNSVYLQGKLEVTYNLYILITHPVTGIGLSKDHTVLEGMS